MKRKRTSDPCIEPQLCDLVLIDADGRSIKVHKAILINKSDYFASILQANNLNELQLNEKYLVELIHYLYNHEDNEENYCLEPKVSSPSGSNLIKKLDQETRVSNGDLEILMQLLLLSKKYGFKQLYGNLMAEINYKLGPSTVLTIYKTAHDLGIEELKNSTRLMILSCLPYLQTTNDFINLPEEAIKDILTAESWDIENDSKLNALSIWWSHNKTADMTNLWVNLITATHSQQ